MPKQWTSFKNGILDRNVNIVDQDGLRLKFNGSYNNTIARITNPRTSGKYYYEIKIIDRGKITAPHYFACFLETNYSSGGFWGTGKGFGLYIHDSIQLFANSTVIKVIESTNQIPSGTVFGIALNYDNKNIKFYRDNKLYAEMSYSFNQIMIAYGGGSSSNGEAEFNFGHKPFAYKVPPGYKSYDHDFYSLFVSNDNIHYSYNPEADMWLPLSTTISETDYKELGIVGNSINNVDQDKLLKLLNLKNHRPRVRVYKENW